MKQQDIILIRFPFSNYREFKIRPALVISNNTYNEKNSDVIICGITSKQSKRSSNLVIGKKDTVNGKLKVKSWIKTDNIASIEQTLIIRKCGQLTNNKYDKVISKLSSIVKRTK